MYIERNQIELENKIAQEAASFAAWCEDNLRIGLEDFIRQEGDHGKMELDQAQLEERMEMVLGRITELRVIKGAERELERLWTELLDLTDQYHQMQCQGGK